MSYPTGRVLDDSDRNILADLAHEACEWHCSECGCCSWRSVGPARTVDIEFVYDRRNDLHLCRDCADAGLPIPTPEGAS